MKRFFILALLHCSLFAIPAMSQTLKEIYESIPDTIMPRLNGYKPEITMDSDTLMQFQANEVKYELAKFSDNKVVLLITLPLPEPDTRAYLYNIYKETDSSYKLLWKKESSRDLSDGKFQFAEATITSVSPLLIQIAQRQPFVPKDEKEEPVVLKNIKLF